MWVGLYARQPTLPPRPGEPIRAPGGHAPPSPLTIHSLFTLLHSSDWPVAVVAETVDDARHFIVGQDVRRAGGEGLQVEFGEGFGFGSEREGFVEIATDHDESVVGHERGPAVAEGCDDVGGEFVGAEGRVGRAADLGAAEQGDEVVHRRQVTSQASDRGGVLAVGVDDGLGVGPGAKDGEVKGVFGGRLACAGDGARREIDVHDVVGGHLVVGQGRGRQEKTGAGLVAHGDIAGGALVEPTGLESEAGVDDLFTKK